MKSPLVNISRSLSGRPNSLLYNRFVLYFVVFISAVNLYTLAFSGNPMYAIMFLLVGFLTSFFSKNMTVILVIAIAITNLVKAGNGSFSRGTEGFQEGATTNAKEGMDEDADSKSDSKSDDKSDSKSKSEKDDDKKDGKTVESLKKDIINDGKDLLKLQEKIVDGFQDIQPYMTQAEELATKINDSAVTIQGMKNK